MPHVVDMNPRERQKANPKVPDSFIQKRFELYKFLGGGAEGSVYKALDHRTGTKVAVKIANRVKDSGIVSHEYEVRAYDSLYRLDGIPKLYWAGQERDYYCMVIQLMGPSLQGLIYEVGGKFSLKTTLLLANQLLFRLEGFHKKGWLHRDIKPSNILIGVGKDAIRPYLADLGLAEKYRPPYAEERYKTLKLLGTELYASWNAHYNRRQSYTDDLESLGYMLIEFMRGDLPWENINTSNRDHRHAAVANLKSETPLSVLCQGLPREFEEYFNHIFSVEHGEMPDYNYLTKNFRKLFYRSGFREDMVYDWTPGRENKLKTREREKEREKVRERIKGLKSRKERFKGPDIRDAARGLWDKKMQEKEDLKRDLRRHYKRK